MPGHDGRLLGYAGARFVEVHARDGANLSGWHLTGVVVVPDARRHGLGSQLTSARLTTLAGRTDTVRCLVDAAKRASVALHTGLGFVEHLRDRVIAGVEFDGGVGLLLRLDLRPGREEPQATHDA